MPLDAEQILAEAERQSEIADDAFISVVWEGVEERHGYPWPDIRVNFAIIPEGEGLAYGLSLPRRLMDGTTAKVRFGKGEGMMRMTPPAPREDVVMALREAIEMFGQPSHLSLE